MIIDRKEVVWSCVLSILGEREEQHRGIVEEGGGPGRWVTIHPLWFAQVPSLALKVS